MSDIDRRRAASQFHRRRVEAPCIDPGAHAPVHGKRQLRIGRNCDPGGEFADTRHLELKCDVAALRCVRVRDRSLQSQRRACDRDIGGQRHRACTQHVGQRAAAKRKDRALCCQRSACAPAQALAWTERQIECVEREGDRTSARSAISQPGGLHGQPDFEVARERLDRLATAGEAQSETPERAVEVRRAGNHAREVTDSRVLRVKLYCERRDLRCSVEVETTGEWNAGDRCANWRAHALGIGVHLDRRVAQIHRKRVQLAHADAHIDVDRNQVAQGNLFESAIGLARIDAQERIEVERRKVESATHPGSSSLEGDREVSCQIGFPHPTVQLGNLDRVPRRSDLAAQRNTADAFQPCVEHARDLRQIVGNRIEVEPRLLLAHVNCTCRFEPRFEEIEVESERPLSVRFLQQPCRTAGHLQDEARLVRCASAQRKGCRIVQFDAARKLVDVKAQPPRRAPVLVPDREISQ